MSSPRLIRRSASAPPMNPLAPVTKTRATSARRGACELSRPLVRRGVRAGLLEEHADALHHLGATLAAVRADRRAEADLDRVAARQRPPGREAHPVAPDRH